MTITLVRWQCVSLRSLRFAERPRRLCATRPLEASPSTARTIRDAARTLCRGDQTPLARRPGGENCSSVETVAMTGAPPERYAGIRPRPAIGTRNLERFHGRQVRIEPACVSSTGERKHFAPSGKPARPRALEPARLIAKRRSQRRRLRERSAHVLPSVRPIGSVNRSR